MTTSTVAPYAVAPKHRNYHCTIANASINGIMTTVVVDTGAGMSIIGGVFYDEYLRNQDTHFVSWKGGASAQAANGQSMKIRGECTVMLKLIGKEQPHNFRVIDDIAFNIILETELIDI